MRIQTFLCVLLAAMVLSGACSTNPATGRSQLNMLSQEHEIRLGDQATTKFLEQLGGEVPSQIVLDHVRQIGKQLAATSERPELPWEFHVVDSEVINAFALPGGKVFISRGLLAKLKNDAQLAGVLGHEVGHVTAKHINDRMARAMGVQLVAVGVGVAGSTSDEDWLKVLGVGTSVGGTIYLLSFNRNQEFESDELGVRYMVQLGYNPYGQRQVMKVLKRASRESGGGGGPEWLATHPLPQSRIDRLTKLIQQQCPDAKALSGLRFGRQSFARQVLSPLKELPPPKHKAKTARLAPTPSMNTSGTACVVCGQSAWLLVKAEDEDSVVQ